MGTLWFSPITRWYFCAPPLTMMRVAFLATLLCFSTPPATRLPHGENWPLLGQKMIICLGDFFLILQSKTVFLRPPNDGKVYKMKDGSVGRRFKLFLVCRLRHAMMRAVFLVTLVCFSTPTGTSLTHGENWPLLDRNKAIHSDDIFLIWRTKTVFLRPPNNGQF